LTMSAVSLSNQQIFRILDEERNEVHYGCDQEWYRKKWQRLSGCGPTAASNIIHYISSSESDDCSSKENCLELMEEVWLYVTPARDGIKTTKMFCESFLAFAEEKGINVEAKVCDVPKEKSLRPGISDVAEFLEEALSNDSPVAFLNLCNGEESNLERWHWVTVVSMEYSEAERRLFIKILDEGMIKRIDLTLWYRTTTLGGGFAYFMNNKDEA